LDVCKYQSIWYMQIIICHKPEMCGYFGIVTPILTMIALRSQWGRYDLWLWFKTLAPWVLQQNGYCSTLMFLPLMAFIGIDPSTGKKTWIMWFLHKANIKNRSSKHGYLIYRKRKDTHIRLTKNKYVCMMLQSYWAKAHTLSLKMLTNSWVINQCTANLIVL
jgi:hypothetical protein